MLRATHFVLLFVVFACAYAAPASNKGPAVIASAPVDLGSTPLAVKEPLPALSGSDDLADKKDLETAANSHYGHHRGGGGWDHHGGGGGWGHHGGGGGWDHHRGGGGWDHHRGGGYHG